MSRYTAPPESESATQPGSHERVLRKKKSIARKREMDREEYEALVAGQEMYLFQITAQTRFTADLLRAMHRAWLGDLYEWAGRYQTVE